MSACLFGQDPCDCGPCVDGCTCRHCWTGWTTLTPEDRAEGRLRAVVEEYAIGLITRAEFRFMLDEVVAFLKVHQELS